MKISAIRPVCLDSVSVSYDHDRTYLKKFRSQPEHAIETIFAKKKFIHTREHFKENNILNIYQLNIFNNFLFATLSQKRKGAQCFYL